MNESIVRLLVVDDHPLFRDSLAASLATTTGLQVVGTTGSVRHALPILESKQPDLMLLDFFLEDGTAIQIVRAAQRQRPRSRTLIVTGFLDEFLASEAIEAGADGVITKTQSIDDLILAIQMVARGEMYVSPDFGVRLRKEPPSSQNDDILGNLSRREREVFRMVLSGSNTKETAKRLFISVKTVDTHRLNINRKLGVRTTAGLIRFAVMHGVAFLPRLTSPDPVEIA